MLNTNRHHWPRLGITNLDYVHAGHGCMSQIKRLVGKFKQRTNVPYTYHYKKEVPYQRTLLLSKIEAYRTLAQYCHPC